MDTDEKEASFTNYIFSPLDLPQISKPPHLRVNIMLDGFPEFDGNSLLAT
jgi:hypothetical protein